ncbi:hypothetical protein CIG75_12860 [Tumebacillus algifaecis]|uniref:Uncharacterized protein n=1 Tax=Tumebacillus algifaecis TaxID=1214604 RepID=A0A223D276_9BACL|nr:hypothetical protein CIG75_12860 [Tumebacillus algifaecis]
MLDETIVYCTKGGWEIEGAVLSYSRSSDLDHALANIANGGQWVGWAVGWHAAEELCHDHQMKSSDR